MRFTEVTEVTEVFFKVAENKLVVRRNILAGLCVFCVYELLKILQFLQFLQ